jgi:hypothetical protein
MASERAHDGLPVSAQTRIAVGLVALPLVAAVAALLLFPLVYYQRYYAPSPFRGYAHTQGLPVVVRIAIAVAFASVPLSAVGGALAIGVRVFRGRVTLPQILVIGVLVGQVPFVFFGALQQLAYMRRGAGVSIAHAFPDVLSVPFMFASMLGLTCAAAFWLIAGASLGGSTQSGSR